MRSTRFKILFKTSFQLTTFSRFLFKVRSTRFRNFKVRGQVCIAFLDFASFFLSSLKRSSFGFCFSPLHYVWSASSSLLWCKVSKHFHLFTFLLVFQGFLSHFLLLTLAEFSCRRFSFPLPPLSSFSFFSLYFFFLLLLPSLQKLKNAQYKIRHFLLFHFRVVFVFSLLSFFALPSLSPVTISFFFLPSKNA